MPWKESNGSRIHVLPLATSPGTLLIFNQLDKTRLYSKDCCPRTVETLKTRYVDGTPTSEVTPVTIWYIHPPHHGHTKVSIMVMNRWLTFPSFHVNQASHSWDNAISNSDLETWRSRSWVWSKGMVIWSAQYLINLLTFHFTSIRPTIPEIRAVLKFDYLSGSYFIMQTNKFLLIDVTAATLGQGHGKVIQYISPDPYILCPKYVRLGTNSFDVRCKSLCGIYFLAALGT